MEKKPELRKDGAVPRSIKPISAEPLTSRIVRRQGNADPSTAQSATPNQDFGGVNPTLKTTGRTSGHEAFHGGVPMDNTHQTHDGTTETAPKLSGIVEGVDIVRSQHPKNLRLNFANKYFTSEPSESSEIQAVRNKFDDLNTRGGHDMISDPWTQASQESDRLGTQQKRNKSRKGDWGSDVADRKYL
jgi:hypothetical protein